MATKDSNSARKSLRSPGFSKAGWSVHLGVGLALIGLVLLPFVPDIKFYYLQVAILVFWFGTLGTAWGISGGYGGQHSVGNAAFVGVGAYTSTLLFVNYGVSPWIGMFAGIIMAALVALVIGYPVFRFGLRGDYFTLATVALGLVAFEIGQGASWLTGGSQGIPISYVDDPLLYQFADRRWFYFIAMILWLVSLLVSYRIRRSRMGFQILAVRDDEAAAARGGVSVLRTKLTAFVITAMITAAAGTFYAQFFLFIDPGAVMGLTLSVQIIVISALGGMGTFLGGTLGALILVPVSQYLASEFSGYPGLDLLMYGAILVLIMMYMPYGILGTLRKYPRWRNVIAW